MYDAAGLPMQLDLANHEPLRRLLPFTRYIRGKSALHVSIASPEILVTLRPSAGRQDFLQIIPCSSVQVKRHNVSFRLFQSAFLKNFNEVKDISVFSTKNRIFAVTYVL